MPSAAHWGPRVSSSHARDGDWSWKGLHVEISALRSIIKPLEPFGHKRGQLPWLDS